MSQVLLKQGLGDAGAELDASHSSSALPTKLYEILKHLAQPKPRLSAMQANVATGVLARLPISQPDTLRELVVNLDVCGTAGNTTVEARVNGTVVGTTTIANTAADPTKVTVTLGTGGAGVDVKSGDVVDINVSAAPTAGTGLAVSITANGVQIE